MKSLVYTAPGVAEVLDRDRPAPGPSEVLVQMVTVGICHSDFDLLAGNYVLPLEFPLVPGHEWHGRVAEIGSAVTTFAVGDRVVGECSVAADEHFGFTHDGALAEYFTVPAAWLHRIPDTIDDTVAALIEPFIVAYGATREFDGGDIVAILGAGPIGLLATASASAKGARTIVVEPDAGRRELARTLGAEDVVDPLAGDATEQVLELTGGRGATGVVECSGNTAAQASALTMAAYHAQLNYVGINVGGIAQAELGLIMGKELRIRGCMGSFGTSWDATIRFVERLPVDLSALVSKRFALTDSLAALEAAKDRNNIKVHIHNPAV
ncbi:zinc-dependent alcohol dehydrogenase [Amycolatopsis granulosa]|uniref:zinc-dependent alcohol dehydrogenase n=1 Tax=Amycolatopsis granulosa TaxID=185684 RepID=UPI001421561D|nr:zinc-binding dehydrogenase [Amycolatopsis granulosa]NIH85249.1 threonine dehydrogenase-like Zn-dependent dehydrogenase [Amycolatopsis granulosa]